VLIVLGAAGMWALGTMTARRGAFPSSAVLATGMELLAGGAVLLVLSAVTGESARCTWTTCPRAPGSRSAT